MVNYEKILSNSKRTIAKNLVLSVTLNKQIYDTCLEALQRIELQTNESDPQKMYCVQKAEYLAYYSIFSFFFDGPNKDHLMKRVIGGEDIEKVIDEKAVDSKAL